MQPALKIARAGKGARRPLAGAGLDLPTGGPCRPMHISLTYKGHVTSGTQASLGVPPPTGSLFGSKLLACPSRAFLQEANGKVLAETQSHHIGKYPRPPAPTFRPSLPQDMLGSVSSLSLFFCQPWAETMGTILGIMGYLKTWLGLLPWEQEALPSTRPS